MENYQVKLVDFEEKSVQEVEETLLKVHEEKTGIPQIEESEEIKLQIQLNPTQLMVSQEESNQLHKHHHLMMPTFFHISKASTTGILIPWKICLSLLSLIRNYYLKMFQHS